MLPQLQRFNAKILVEVLQALVRFLQELADSFSFVPEHGSELDVEELLDALLGDLVVLDMD